MPSTLAPKSKSGTGQRRRASSDADGDFARYERRLTFSSGTRSSPAADGGLSEPEPPEGPGSWCCQGADRTRSNQIIKRAHQSPPAAMPRTTMGGAVPV